MKLDLANDLNWAYRSRRSRTRWEEFGRSGRSVAREARRRRYHVEKHRTSGLLRERHR